MDRSLRAVLVGTFTLRFSTGLTGCDARRSTSPTCPSHGGPSGRRHGRRPVRGDRSTSPSWSCRRSSASCPTATATTGSCSTARSSAAIAVVLDRADRRTCSLLGGTRILEGASTRRERAVDPRLHRPRHGRQRGCCAARPRRASRARPWPGSGSGSSSAPKLFEAIGPTAFFLNARHLRRLVPDLLVRRQGPGRRGGGGRRRARRVRPLPRRSSGRRTSAAGADLDRRQRGHRAVVQPVALPVREGRTRASPTRC